MLFACFSITGGELFHFVEEQTEGHLTERQSIHIIRQILDAVAHMHNLYLAHLDLKVSIVIFTSILLCLFYHENLLCIKHI